MESLSQKKEEFPDTSHQRSPDSSLALSTTSELMQRAVIIPAMERLSLSEPEHPEAEKDLMTMDIMMSGNSRIR